MGSKTYSSLGTPLVGTTGTGLDQLIEEIGSDLGLAGANEGSHILGGQTAAEGLNHLIFDAAQATGASADGIFTVNEVIAINTWIRENHLAEFVALHGDDEGNEETGFHLVQNDGATRRYRGDNLVNTVIDSIYHIGFEIQNGVFLNEDGDANASVSQVADWLTQFFTDHATTNTGLDQITELILADSGLAQNVSWHNIAGGADAANGINKLYQQAIATLNLANDGSISEADILQINNWIRSDASRYALFIELHGDDEGNVETGFHLVQNDGANKIYFGQNLVNTVADGLYHIGFEVLNGRFNNEDGNANATIKDVSDWATYFYVDQSTTGTGLDQIVDIIKRDEGLAEWTNAGNINRGADAADDLNHLIVEAIQATSVDNDGWITIDDLRVINGWIHSNRYDTFVELHGDDENGVETGFHLVQNDGGTTQYFGKNLINTVADGIYHIGFSIVGSNFLNEDGDTNASLSDVASWLNYFYGGKTVVYGTEAEEIIAGSDQSEHLLAYGSNDTINAGGGDDLLEGAWGCDVLNGDSGNDILYGGGDNDIVNGGLGNDTITAGIGNDTVNGEEGSDTYIVTGNEAGGWSSFSGYDSYSDTGVSGTDRIIASGIGAVDIGLLKFGTTSGIEVINGTGATGTVRLLGNWEANSLNFSTVQLIGSNITIDAGYGNDTVTGSSANDTILTGGDNDIFNGREGSDTYIVTGNEAGGWSSFSGYDSYSDTGVSGTDRIIASGIGAVDIGLLKFGTTSGIEVINGTGATGTVRLLGNWEANSLNFSTVQLIGSNITIDAGYGNDTVTGSSANDTILAGDGDDQLTGGLGADLLTGGRGNDSFIFRSINEIGIGNTKDTILDFTNNQDLINLKNIDANTLITGDQAFTYIATGIFTGVASQLRFSEGILSGDINGDKVSDFELAITGVTFLVSTNFVL